MPDQFPEAAEYDQQGRKAGSHAKPIRDTHADGVARRKDLRSCDDCAVGNDQRDKYTERPVQGRKPGFEDEFDAGNQARDDEDIDRYPDFLAYPSACDGYECVGKSHYKQGRNAEP
mgnify:CR=1 FL=1